jgi:hypothetical protein
MVYPQHPIPSSVESVAEVCKRRLAIFKTKRFKKVVMQKASMWSVKLFCVVLLLSITQIQIGRAGWTGLINGKGVGWAGVNVRSVTLFTNRVQTVTNTTLPSAAMSPTLGYLTNAPLPSGAATNTYSRIKGLSGGVWQAASKAAVGDGTDNLELESHVLIIPSECASISFDSKIEQNQDEFNANGNSGTITVNASATAGTALWLRGFEFDGGNTNIPPDDPDTVENESVEWLKTHGVVKFETLIVGPFEFGSNNCPLIIPFSLGSSNLENLYFAADGVAKSLPLVIGCPADVVATCSDPIYYPSVTYAGCGNITVSFNPPLPPAGHFPAGYFPVGTTPVTVTATDSDGNSTNCTFSVIIVDTMPPVRPVLPTLALDGCSGGVAMPKAPTTTDDCAGTVTGTTTTTQLAFGTNVINWTFDDGHSNTTTVAQTVIVNGLTFTGFYSPINGTGGTCASPLRNINQGSINPIKFDMFCGSTKITGGTPPVVQIQAYSSNCSSSNQLVSVNAVYQNDWHFNWDTTGWAKGVYRVHVILPDSTSQNVFVKIK